MWLDKIYEQSPSVQLFVAKKTREHTCELISRTLNNRFGPVPDDVAAHLRAIDDQQKLNRLHDVAIDCADLNVFRAAMTEAS